MVKGLPTNLYVPNMMKLIHQRSVLIFLFSTYMIYLKTVYSLALNQVSTFTISLKGILLLKINSKTKQQKKQNPQNYPKGLTQREKNKA